MADIGALCNDVGFGLAHARALTLRERLLRLNASVTGHRLLRGAITPGEVHLRALPQAAELEEIGERFRELVELARGQSTVVDRFTGTAVLRAEDADALGVLGVVARASGSTLDARVAHPVGGEPLQDLLRCELRTVTYWHGSTYVWKKWRRLSPWWRTTACNRGHSCRVIVHWATEARLLVRGTGPGPGLSKGGEEALFTESRWTSLDDWLE